MGAAFWIKRFLQAAVPLFAILVAVEMVKGTTTQADILSAGAWAVVAAAIFVGAAWRRYRRALDCSACDSALQKNSKDKAAAKR